MGVRGGPLRPNRPTTTRHEGAQGLAESSTVPVDAERTSTLRISPTVRLVVPDGSTVDPGVADQVATWLILPRESVTNTAYPTAPSADGRYDVAPGVGGAP